MSKLWLDFFDSREQREIDFARLYAAQYDHGTPGHLQLLIIAKLAALLDRREGLAMEYAIDRTMVEVERWPA